MQLKKVYNHEFLASLADALLEVDKNFEKQKFLEKFEDQTWAQKELKQRMRAITNALGESLNQKDFSTQIEILKKAVVKISKNKNSGLALIIFPDFIEVFGERQILKQVQDDDAVKPNPNKLNPSQPNPNKLRHPELVSGSINIINKCLNALWHCRKSTFSSNFLQFKIFWNARTSRYAYLPKNFESQKLLRKT